MIGLVVLVCSVILSAIVGTLVFLRNPRSKINQIYFVLTILLILYPIANYLSLQSNNSIVYIRLVLALTSLAVMFLYLLIIFIADPKRKLLFIQRLGVLYTFLVAFLSLTPLVFKDVSNDGALVPTASYGAVLYFIQFTSFLIVSLITLVLYIRESKGLQKIQFQYMLIGVIPIVFLAPVTGFIMPVLFDNSSLINLSPAYATSFVLVVGYSIIKHRLFDIRPALARSLGYLLSVGFISLVYGIVLIVFAKNVFDISISSTAIIFLSIATGVTALIAPTWNQQFTKLTKNIFYKDSYVPQELINTVNSKIVNSVEIDQLIGELSQVMSRELNVDRVEFIIDNNSANLSENGTEQTHKNTNSILNKFTEIIENDDQTVYLASDELLDKELLGPMQQAKIECAIKMRANNQKVGTMIVGPRKSGNALLNQDIQILKIIASETAIAIQNTQRYEEIKSFNATLQTKINEATKKLQKSNEKLQALDEAKDEFISMASHQLRTPLTSVKGYISMILEGDAGDINDLQKKFLNQAFISSQRMVYLISDLLNVSRLKTGKFVIENSETYLPDTVEQELKQLDETVKARGLKLEYKKPKNFPTVMLDEEKIRQVIMNFADNAIYYTPSGGKIVVELKATNSTIEYAVKDSGIGVPRHEQHHLFTKFYRAVNARKARPDGTGLGLFMAKKVITAQGGAIIFNSTEGKGSTFGFTFPRQKIEQKN
jgi:signal transduction histidine kinase